MTLSGTSGTVGVLSNNSGADYELTTGDKLYAVSAISNIDSEATVYSVDVIPTDAEDLELYRELDFAVIRLEPNGGSASDYVF